MVEVLGYLVERVLRFVVGRWLWAELRLPDLACAAAGHVHVS